MRMTVIAGALLLASSTAYAQAQPPAAPPAPQKFPLTQYLLRGFDGVQRNILEAAEKMPEENYSFRPTPEIRPFGQVVAHIALSRFGACSALKGQENPHKGDKEDQSRTKAEVIALLKDGYALCSDAFKALTDESLTQFVKMGTSQNEVAKGLLLASENSHSNEVYGTMAVYLRLKGLVPPSTERQTQHRH